MGNAKSLLPYLSATKEGRSDEDDEIAPSPFAIWGVLGEEQGQLQIVHAFPEIKESALKAGRMARSLVVTSVKEATLGRSIRNHYHSYFLITGSNNVRKVQ